MEQVQNGRGDLVTSCHHHFHEHCLLQWYLESDVCPVCRTEQTNKFIDFKKHIQERTAEMYLEVIDGLEIDLARFRRRRAQRAE